MAHDDDPFGYVDRLRQALEDPRRPIALLISAGCPLAVEGAHGAKPLIPDVRGMTVELKRVLKRSKHKDAFEKLERVLAVDGKADADIEYVLSLVRTLADVAGARDARGLTADELKALDAAISDAIADLAGPSLPGSDTPYHDAMRWVGGTDRDHPVELFTTNYDVLAEQALEAVGVPFFDGFVGAWEPFFDVRAIEDDEIPRRWARLWKLHGSINWCRSERNTVIRVRHTSGLERRLIHPSHLKYDESRRMPYVALIDRLRDFFRRSKAVLITCGYSFRDQHLNAVLREGLERNASAAVFGLVHGALTKYAGALEVARRTGNLVLLAPEGGVVGREECSWRRAEDGDSDQQTPGVEVVGDELRLRLGDFAIFAGLLRDLSGVPS